MQIRAMHPKTIARIHSSSTHKLKAALQPVLVTDSVKDWGKGLGKLPGLEYRLVNHLDSD